MSITEREEILVGIRAGESLSEIARAIGRVPSVVTREVAANGGREGYSAWAAHQRARQAAWRPKPCKLRAGRLLDEVTKRSRNGGINWSSQHFDDGGVDGQASGMDEGVDGSVADEVAGRASASPRSGEGVLDGDREVE